MDWPAPVLSAYLMPVLLKTNRLCQDVFRFTSLGLAVGARLGPQHSMAAAVDTKDCASFRENMRQLNSEPIPLAREEIDIRLCFVYSVVITSIASPALSMGAERSGRGVVARPVQEGDDLRGILCVLHNEIPV